MALEYLEIAKVISVALLQIKCQITNNRDIKKKKQKTKNNFNECCFNERKGKMANRTIRIRNDSSEKLTTLKIDQIPT